LREELTRLADEMKTLAKDDSKLAYNKFAVQDSNFTRGSRINAVMSSPQRRSHVCMRILISFACAFTRR
jgi:hypothetical protein